jgi:putative component of membrane protein insertase Oxa1/YidC/SpoIIIJ protein YidD
MIASPINPASFLIARVIEAYQRFISPYKGFRCAHRAVHGKDSCSQFAKRVVTRRGMFAMFPLLRRRFTECGVAAQVLDYEARESARGLNEKPTTRRSSSCDVSPDACDVLDCGAEACNVAGGVGDCTPDVSCDVF